MSACILKFSDIIRCEVYKFDDYYYDKDDHYIYGLFDKLDISKCTDSEKIYTTIDGKNTRVLLHEDSFVNQRLLSSLISLRQKLPEFNYCHELYPLDTENIKQIEEQILKDKKRNSYINLILKWCRRNGMPFVGDIYNNAYFKTVTSNTNDYSYYGFKNDFNYFLSKELPRFKFRLGVFLIGIDILYTTFVLAISLNKEKLFDYNYTDYIDKYLTTLPIDKFDNISPESRQNLINNYIKSMQIHVKSTFNSKNELTHSLYGDTLFSAAMYQLMLFVAYGNNKTIICKSCEKIYIHRRNNMFFCSDACRQAWHRDHPD